MGHFQPLEQQWCLQQQQQQKQQKQQCTHNPTSWTGLIQPLPSSTDCTDVNMWAPNDDNDDEDEEDI